MLAIKTNILSYNMISNNEIILSWEYSLSLYSVFFFEKHISRLYEYSFKNIKYLENDLTSSKKIRRLMNL